MTETGGSTTQSGILYQNSVAALYLGRLLDVSYRSDKERVEQVRVEAPIAVDDTVVSFADGHQIFIQSKEYLRNNRDEWKTLWRHFDEQFRDSKFQHGKDRLLLQIGFGLEEHHTLQGICERAANSTNAEEWQGRLSQSQNEIIDKITPYLSPTGLTIEHSRDLFAHIDVKVLSLEDIEQDRLRDWMPLTNRTQKELFRLLRDHVGGEARVKGIFTAHSLIKILHVESPALQFNIPRDIGEIRNAVKQCGSLLQHHANTISGTNVHIKREVVDKIVEWLLNDSPTEKNVSLLLDQAGMGKTVVMRDVLLELQHSEIDTLAIKADQQLSDVNSLDTIQKKLGLSYPVEQIVSRLAQLNRVVVLIDQIDALSLSLAHDQQAINTTLDLVARLRRIPNVRVLLSCRIFDWNTDPRFKTIETEQIFSIPKLTGTQLKDVLNRIQINFDQLTSATKELLSIPLHLDLFARAVTTNDIEFEELRGIGSLQELYALIWQHVVLRQDNIGPLVSERVEVINKLIEFMDTWQRTTAPQSLLQTPEMQHLERAITWLASVGILIRGKTDWNFLHQTFFDYCYARRFVESGNDVVISLLNSGQGIFERPKLIQIIAYLRSSDRPRYIRDLQRLLDLDNLRFHLYDLLLHWFGALSNPSEDEWQIAQKILIDDLRFPQFLLTMYGNLDWFNRLEPSIHRWLTDTSKSAITCSYLTSLMDIAQDRVVALLEPFLGRSDEWNDRIALALFHIHDWQTDRAIALYERNVYQQKETYRRDLLHLEVVCEISPETGCRIIRHLFDLAQDSYFKRLEQHDKEKKPSHFSSSYFLDTELRDLEGTIETALASLSSKAPVQYVKMMLPWIVNVVKVLPHRDDMQRFTLDVLSYNWYDNTFRIQHAFVHSILNALTQIARDEPESFRQIAQRLESLPYQTPQKLLINVFQAMPEIYAEDALNFLLGDQRRLDLGDIEQYESRQVISAIFPYLSSDQRRKLETKILQYFRPINKKFGLEGLRWRGFEQYCLLHSVPIQLLSGQGQKRFHEWERKFPGVVISDKPTTMQSGFVSSPIPNDLAKKMSNRSWLRAIRKYQHEIRLNRFLGGGAEQLSVVLSNEIKSDPERFHKLFKVVPIDIDDSYVMAFANGFAESTVPAEWTFEVFRRYANQKGRIIKRELSYTIQKLVKQDIPDDIIAKLFEWAYEKEGEAESWWAKGETNGDIYNSYLNSDRGAAFGTLMRILDEKSSMEAIDKKWELLEFVSSDDSFALRLGAIQELSYMIQHDRERSCLLFEKLLAGHELLSETRYVREFLHWGLYKNFLRVKPFVEQMIGSSKPEVREMGAELACIASISENAIESEDAIAAAKTLADEIIRGDTSMRRGATSVYVFNMTQGSKSSVRTQCLENIRKLVNDEDKEVRNKIIQKFFSLSDEFFFEFRGLMEDIALSEYYSIDLQFANYLWKYGMFDPDWTLSIIRILVSKSVQPQQWDSGVEELIRFTLRVYTSQANGDSLREEAMNIFDILMKKDAGTANNILLEWDRY